MLNVIKHVLNIDDLGNRVFSKILFAFLFVIKVWSGLCPIGDSNFYPLYKWSQDVLENTELIETYQISDIPITTGNIIYVLFVLVIDFLLVTGSLVYCGAYIRDYRHKTAKRKVGIAMKPISISNLILRLSIICAFLIVFFLPITIFVLYLPLIFIIIFPCLIVYIACYLSGDKGLITAISFTFKRTRGFYLLIARDISAIMLAYFVLEYFFAAIGEYVPVFDYVVVPFFMVYIFLVAGRYAGFIYCRIIEMPIFAFQKPVVKR